jgi:hypothetical protein
MLSLTRKREVVVVVIANVVSILDVLLSTVVDDDEDEQFTVQFETAIMQCEQILEALNKPSAAGRGRLLSGTRLPTLSLPLSDMYNDTIRNADRFQALCRYNPSEFEQLYLDVQDVLALCRDVDGVYTEEENRMRKKRRFKYSARERLFHFLVFLTHYPKLTESSTNMGISRTALHVDVHWLRSRLSIHPVLVAEVQWGTPLEVERERRMYVDAGLLPGAFANNVAMCDGTKDLARRLEHYNRTNEPDYSHKGNGKSHLLVSCSLAL